MGKLYIIAGHGAGDPGAIGNGYQEQERVRVLANKINDLGGSNVVLMDTSIKYSANTSKLASIPKDANVLELHLDASSSTSARGSHIIIHSSLSADSFDNAIVAFMCKEFPGRSTQISKRSDLACVNKCKSLGLNYRLLECCFITNSADLNKFNSNIDYIAQSLLSAFGIDSTTGGGSSTPSSDDSTGKTQSSIAIDGYWGVATTTKAQSVFGTVEDGIVSNQASTTKKYHLNCQSTSWKYGTGGSTLIKAIQGKVKTTPDGKCGPTTIKGIQKLVSVSQDGYCGPKTVVAFQTWLNKQ